MTSAEGSWVVDVVEGVNGALEAFFSERRARAAALSPAAPELVDAVAALTLRGGKRLRAAALHAGFCAVAGAHPPSRTAPAGVALELLQSYFLIQDDWMDGDRERRGGPAVHVALSEPHGDARLGASLAILAADLASSFAWEALTSAPFPPARLPEALWAFGQLQLEVVAGQQLDLIGHPDVPRMHQLKTGSYTVRGPLLLGALLANASEAEREALVRFGEPLGLAFQLRDDLLGAFGDEEVVGKPIGNDLLAGKHNALIAAAIEGMGSEDRRLLDAVFGKPEASSQAVEAALGALSRSGARQRVEQRLAEQLSRARERLQGAPLQPAGIAMLQRLVELIGARAK